MASCSSSNKEREIQNSQNQRATVEVYEPTYDGVWVNEKYLNALKQTHSPKVAQNAAYTSMISIPHDHSGEAIVVHNFHEGTTYQLKFLGDSYIFSSTEGSDTLKFEQEDKIAIWKNEKFQKLQQHYGENRIIEELLLEGVYNVDGQASTVELKHNGQVTGLGNYQYYKGVLDYFDAGMQLDQIELSEDGKNWDKFGFSIEGNKQRLHIFELKCEEFDSQSKTCQEVSRGKEVYLLIRQGGA
ncbi:MAG: hypothetical protein OHK0038_03130 [Flammeovirgaceae bacterium]